MLGDCEKELAKKDPFSLIEDGHLWIKPKEGEVRPLILNKAQKYLISIIKKLWFENKIIRLWILKARQLGISTLIEAVIYSITSQNSNIDALIVADDKDDSTHIFEMSKLYQEKCPLHLKTETRRSNEKKLEFEDTHSQILIDTAENKNAGRNFTFRLVHLSNYAFFPYPKELMNGLDDTVPSLPRTMIAKETTAKGENFAKVEWEKINKTKTEWTPVFLPWFWDEGYKMEAKESFIIGDESLGDLTVDESMLVSLMEKENITDIKERLAWRRWKIINGKDGDVYAFKQENPSIPEEAFEGVIGNPRFNIRALNKLRQGCQNPIKGSLTYANGEVYFEEGQGCVEVYNYPDNSRYAIGADTSEGIGNDRSSASAVNLSTLTEDVVINSSKLDPSQFAIELWKLGHWCNKALIAVEGNGSGLACIIPLRNGQGNYAPYKNLYYKEILDEQTKKKTKKYGWTTNAKTKPLMIDKLAEMIREGLITIPSEDTIRELQTFVIEENGKMNAVEGCHDDRVISLAIACVMYSLRPTVKLPDEAPVLQEQIY